MSTVTIENHTLNYHYHLSDKNSPTLLFIHDLCMDSEMWKYTLPHMGQHFNLLTYDFYGHGKTTDTLEPSSLHLLTHELLALLHYLELDCVHIVGCKYGAFLALELAINYPNLVSSLALISLPFYIQKDIYDRDGSINLQLIQLDQALFVKKYIIENTCPVALSKARLITRALHRIPNRHLYSSFKDLIIRSGLPNGNTMSKLKQLQKPILFMHGENDPIFPPTLAMIYSQFAANSRFMVIQASSSLIPLDQPEYAADTLCQFLNKYDSMSSVHLRKDGFIRSLHQVLEQTYQSRFDHPCELRLSIMSGVTHVFWNNEELNATWTRRNARELLLFIILKKGVVHRDTIINAFLTDMAIDHARNHLRVQLNYLNTLFRNQADPALRHVLIVTRESVALNADVKSDLGEFMESIEDMIWSNAPIEERVRNFLILIEDFKPTIFHTWKGGWIKKIEQQITNQLIQILEQILFVLTKEGNDAEIQRILSKCMSNELYKDRCEHYTNLLDQRNGTSRKGTPPIPSQ
ncbi:alpha/beta fold hydrolase [Sporolactobacillus kofuensis]|uniref:Alpha/beta fold hydrolase n=1 Tax=Sporolactobacillus kofuensis TaxID=269672 RepID=A0ABW1WDD4_9BACL|nr:alpha/beta hydrolase [Sporolactobacillus kofuensis]MCO7176720.1 alpha/beta hydrolase [Sporolactobacillus kofuensis]